MLARSLSLSLSLSLASRYHHSIPLFTLSLQQTSHAHVHHCAPLLIRWRRTPNIANLQAQIVVPGVCAWISQTPPAGLDSLASRGDSVILQNPKNGCIERLARYRLFYSLISVHYFLSPLSLYPTPRAWREVLFELTFFPVTVSLHLNGEFFLPSTQAGGFLQ